MKNALRGSFCGTSLDGTATMDMDGVTFLVKRLKDVDVTKTTCCGSSFVLEISYFLFRTYR